MKHIFFAIICLPVVVSLSACATSPSAELLCAAETKAEQAQTYTKMMQRDSRKNIRKLSILANTPMSGGISTKLQTRAVTILRGVDMDLKEGRGLIRLKQLSETCQDMQLVESSLANLLMTDTANPSLAAFVKATDIYGYWVNLSSEELKLQAAELDIPLPRMEEF